jgi:hypothetical protein
MTDLQDAPGLAEPGTAHPVDDTTAPRSAHDDVRLARIHLRLGMLSIARAELEDLERRAALGRRDQAVLAEARWRTGEAGGAAAAAAAHLDAGGGDPVAIAIAVEAAAADGRPAEARRLMDRLDDLDASAIDALFGGMPQRAFWPSLPGSTTVRALVDEAEPGAAGWSSDRVAAPGATGWSSSDRDVAERTRRLAEAERAAADEVGARVGSGSFAGSGAVRGAAGSAGSQAVLASTAPSLWSDTGDAADPGQDADRAGEPSGRERGDAPSGREREAAGPASRRIEHPDPLEELTQAREELASEPDRALIRIALVLRADPTLAPDVLDALSLRREPMAAIIRGDAQRLMGRHLEAEAAFTSAGDDLDRPERPTQR